MYEIYQGHENEREAWFQSFWKWLASIGHVFLEKKKKFCLPVLKNIFHCHYGILENKDLTCRLKITWNDFY